MSGKECIMKLSRALFWDVDVEQADMERNSGFIIQRVLEYGSLEDWRLILSYFGIGRIAEECKKLRTLDPICLSFVCMKSGTDKTEYRCYHTRLSNPTLWNS